MKLVGKKLLMLVSDGVEQQEFEELKNGFEKEMAEVFCTSPQEYMNVETVANFRRGKDLSIDFPIEAVEPDAFDGLIIPDGLLSVDLLRRDHRVIELVRNFHHLQLPVFASGRAVEILYESGTLPEQVLVRDHGPLDTFVEDAIQLLLDNTSTLSKQYSATG
jgi:putative intracellular protease/amidase